MFQNVTIKSLRKLKQSGELSPSLPRDIFRTVRPTQSPDSVAVPVLAGGKSAILTETQYKCSVA